MVEAGPATAPSDTALISTGLNFPDALASGPLAYKGGHPIGISNGTDMPDQIIDALKAVGVDKALVVGGPLSVPQSVIDELNAKGITVQKRLARTTAGQTNRSGTAAEVAEYAVANLGFSNAGVNVASGRPAGDGADALSGGPLSGQQNRPVLITNTENAPGTATVGYLKSHACTLTDGNIFGGPLAISAAAEATMQAAARDCATNQAYTVTPASKTSVAPDKTITYTVGGLTSGDSIRIALVDPAVYDAATGTFELDAQNRHALLTDATNVVITKINGVDVSNAVAKDFTANGSTVTFTVADTTANAAQAVPVVFKKSSASDTSLDVNLDGKPLESAGVGGEADFVPAAVPAPAENDTATVDGAVTSVNDNTSFVTDDAANTGSLIMRSTDNYELNGSSVTEAQFQSILSVDDVVSVDYVKGADAASPSTFNITTDAFPSNGEATSALGTPTADGNTVSIDYAHPVDATIGGTSYQIERRQVVSSIPGPWSAVKSGTVESHSTQTYTETPSNGTYQYRMVYTAPAFSGSGPATGTASTEVDVPSTPAATTAPSTERTYTTDNSTAINSLGAGDTFKIVFNKAITAPIQGATITVTDGTDTGTFTYTASDSTVAGASTFSVNSSAVTIDGATLDAGQVLTVTVLKDPANVINFPATITAYTGIANSAGPATVDSNTGIITQK